MCGKTPKTPKVVQRDPIAEQKAAEARAQIEANAATANKRRKRGMAGVVMGAMRQQQAATGGPSLLAQARPEG